MISFSQQKFFRIFFHTGLIAIISCSKTASRTKNRVDSTHKDSAGANNLESRESMPNGKEPGPSRLSLLGTDVSEVPMAASGSVDNGTIASINLFVREPKTGKSWFQRVGSGLYADGVVITAAHVIEELKSRTLKMNANGNYTRPYFVLPRLPGFERKAFSSTYGATPLRAGCYTDNSSFWNDVGVLRFDQPAARLAVERKISELAGLPSTKKRNSPLNFSPQLTTGHSPKVVRYYGRRNNGADVSDQMFVSMPNSAIKSTACPTGGPCYFVFNGTLSEPGDSGGPLWMPDVGWIGVITGKGARPTNVSNVSISPGCGNIGDVTFNMGTLTTYFAKFSANSDFFRTVLSNHNRNGFWSDAVNGVYQGLYGFDLNSKVSNNLQGGVAPASGLEATLCTGGIPEID